MSEIERELEAIRERDRAEWAARDCAVCGRMIEDEDGA